MIKVYSTIWHFDGPLRLKVNTLPTYDLHHDVCQLIIIIIIHYIYKALFLVLKALTSKWSKINDEHQSSIRAEILSLHWWRYLSYIDYVFWPSWVSFNFRNIRENKTFGQWTFITAQHNLLLSSVNFCSTLRDGVE